jgi:FkbM family methyltransferase
MIPPLRAYYRSPLPGKKAMWKYVGSHLWFAESPTVAKTFFGASMFLDARDISGRYIAYFGIWEPNLTHWLQRSLKQGDQFIDVGANLGYFSLLASSLGANVTAIEAAPRTHEALLRNIAANECSIRAVNAAAWDEATTLELFVDPDKITGTSSVIPNLAEQWKLRTMCKVKAAPLTELLTREEIKAARVIKIDVEGAETHVVRSLIPILESGRPDLEVAIELALGETTEELISIFHNRGFKMFHLPNVYSPALYLANRTPERLKKLDMLPKDEMVDVVFSRQQADTI